MMESVRRDLRILLFIISALFCTLAANRVAAQEDLLSLLGEDEETVDYTTASFKTTKVINLQSIENVGARTLDVKINHRFGFINGGFYDLFGLDQASIRIGVDYGLTKNLMFGVGRSSFEKTYDGFIKYRLLHQSTGKRVMPFTLSLVGTSAIKTISYTGSENNYEFKHRLYYTGQMIIGRKFSEGFSFQVSPTIVHRNLVETSAESNDIYSVGFASRLKLTKRLSLNSEYILPVYGTLAPGITNSLSIGFDIETGGHVFQLHFSNSTSMIEKGFFTETVGEWQDGDIHFGFNISRVF